MLRNLKNLNTGQISKFWSKIEILDKIESLVTNQNFSQKSIFFTEKSKVWSKI